jgi:hypothetical protein
MVTHIIEQLQESSDDAKQYLSTVAKTKGIQNDTMLAASTATQGVAS